ncbi:SLATT domain-containing protein [Pendulispora brunnea]|uniref:SLATT domain-containing protein n=1 Tax=Pendulispora brunnea TaxID=2905690 RepID=A0ABZ2K9Z8_9BACT
MTREERNTLPPEHDNVAAHARAIRVSVMDGIDAGRSVVVFADMRIHVGTEELSDLRLRDRTVSPRHLAIDCVGHRFRMTDLESVNGTRLNGVPVSEAYIVAGDVVSCGNIKLAITAENAKQTAFSRSVAMGKNASHLTPPDIKDLLAEWQAWAQVFSKSHRRAALRLERRHYWLGIPSTLMGAVVGTTIFGTLEKAAGSWPFKIALAAISMSAACLVALQTFLRYLERAGQHNLAHAEYEDIARSIELLSLDSRSRRDWVKSLEGLGHRLDAIKGKAPIPPDAEDLELEFEEAKERFRMRLSASVKFRESMRQADTTPNVRHAGFSLPPPMGYLNGPLEPSRFYEDDERIALRREAKERARYESERKIALDRANEPRWEAPSFAAQLRAFEDVDG